MSKGRFLLLLPNKTLGSKYFELKAGEKYYESSLFKEFCTSVNTKNDFRAFTEKCNNCENMNPESGDKHIWTWDYDFDSENSFDLGEELMQSFNE